MPARRPPAPALRVLLLPALLLPALLLSGCAGEETPAETPRRVLVQQPEPAVEAVQAFAGEVRARHETPLAFRVGGKLATRQVEIGERVRAGQVLATLDADDLRLAREAAEAQLAAAEAEARLAAAEFERIEVMFERQLVSRSLFDARRSVFEAAGARVEQARAQREAAANQADYGVLRAPAAGVVVQRLVEAGQVVAAGQPAFVLAEEGAREVLVALPESEIARFRIGQAVQIELWATAQRRLSGQIREIAPAADPATRTFAARVAIAPVPDLSIELGQSARVYVARSGETALSVPLSALTESAGQPALWVLAADRRSARRVVVETGAFGQTAVPVLSGLRAEDWVVVAGVHLLREGQALDPVDPRNRPVPPLVAAAAPGAAE